MKFSTPVLLFGASPIDIKEAVFFPRFSNLPVVAADGGVHSAVNLGLTPLALIGDMDSLSPGALIPNKTRRILVSDQDDTDFEKSIRLIDAPLIMAIGFLDGRLDHTLSVIDVLARDSSSKLILLIGQNDVLLRVKGSCDISLYKDCRISIWPLGRQEFRGSKGLVWPLENIKMEVGTKVGTSNRVSDGPVSIEAGEGDGYAVITPTDAFEAIFAAAMTMSKN